LSRIIVKKAENQRDFSLRRIIEANSGDDEIVLKQEEKQPSGENDDDNASSSSSSNYNNSSINSQLVKSILDSLRNISIDLTKTAAPDHNASHHSNLNDSSKQCPICLGDFEIGEEICMSKNIECPHAFHSDCMLEWLMKHDDCPLCRKDYLLETTKSNISTSTSPMDEQDDIEQQSTTVATTTITNEQDDIEQQSTTIASTTTTTTTTNRPSSSTAGIRFPYALMAQTTSLDI
jgi:hypothetical protein